MVFAVVKGTYLQVTKRFYSKYILLEVLSLPKHGEVS